MLELPVENTSDQERLQLSQTVPVTEAEGPGRRFAIWFQGCPLRCPGCCNPEMLPFSGGTATATEDLVESVVQSQSENHIEGVTLIGGEPFAHAAGAAPLAEAVREHGLTVMIFTGFVREELEASDDLHVARLLAACDLMVDGPYQREEPDSERRWIGSRNQRIHFLSDAYKADDPRWRTKDSLEIRFENGQILINGFPAPEAKGLWKDLVRKERKRS